MTKLGKAKFAKAKHTIYKLNSALVQLVYKCEIECAQRGGGGMKIRGKYIYYSWRIFEAAS